MTGFIAINNVSAIETTSNEILFDTKGKVYTLSGDAKVKFNENTFNANKIIVKQYPNNSKKPESIEASGKLLFKNNDIEIMADRCICDMQNIIFYNNVFIKEKKIGNIKADSAIYNIESKKVDITADKKVKLKLNDEISKKFDKKILK